MPEWSGRTLLLQTSIRLATLTFAKPEQYEGKT